jgi:hypothetical protein
MASTTTTVAETYYPPSLISSITTQWIPLTTKTWAGESEGSGASSFWSAGTNGKGLMHAWMWDDEYHSWDAEWWPPEATLSFRSSVVVRDPAHTVFSVGPFAGCPASWSEIAGYSGASSSATTCCPP